MQDFWVTLMDIVEAGVEASRLNLAEVQERAEKLLLGGLSMLLHILSVFYHSMTWGFRDFVLFCFPIIFLTSFLYFL